MLTNHRLLDLFWSCQRIRMIEEAIADRYAEQEMRCPTHLSIGQELAGAALGMATTKNDLAVSTHRSHAHYLGKGGNIDSFIAELYGRETGCAKGMGGSMHLKDEDAGFMASTAIVGNSIPVGVGLALGEKLNKTNNIITIFVGDAVFETGVFYESLNIAATFQLPALFICENNFYSVYSPLSVRQPEGRANHKIAESIGIKTKSIDGMDAAHVLNEMDNAVHYCREACAPFLLEMTAYRWREHCGPNYDNNIGYREEDEYLEWKSKDYLTSLEVDLKSKKIINDDDIFRKQQSVSDEINAAFTFAINSDLPSSDRLSFLEYAEK